MKIHFTRKCQIGFALAAMLAGGAVQAADVIGDEYQIELTNIAGPGKGKGNAQGNSAVTSAVIITPDGESIASADFIFTSSAGFSDGLYQYQVAGLITPSGTNQAKAGMNNGRDPNAKPGPPIGVIDEGVFTLSGGLVVDASLTEY